MGSQLEDQFVEILKQMNALYECMDQGFLRINEKLDGIDKKLNHAKKHLGDINEKLDGIVGHSK